MFQSLPERQANRRQPTRTITTNWEMPRLQFKKATENGPFMCFLLCSCCVCVCVCVCGTLKKVSV